MSVLKKRVENLEAKLNPGYLTLEGIIEWIDLGLKKDRTQEEQRRLDELSVMEVEPKLRKTIMRLEANAQQKEARQGNNGR